MHKLPRVLDVVLMCRVVIGKVGKNPESTPIRLRKVGSSSIIQSRSESYGIARSRPESETPGVVRSHPESSRIGWSWSHPESARVDWSRPESELTSGGTIGSDFAGVKIRLMAIGSQIGVVGALQRAHH